MDPLEVFFEIHRGLERESPGRNRYTRQAFQLLPSLDRPSILDIGCGPGAATMGLARLSNGSVTGLDLHQPFVDQLNVKIDEAGLSDRVRALCGSMFEMHFPDSSFDIRTIPENLEQVAACGYRLISLFTLPEDAWWVGYYNPVEKRLKGLRKKYLDSPEALAVLDQEQKEIEMYRKYSEWYGSAFFLMQKIETEATEG